MIETGLEKVVAKLVQQVERRFYGKYRGLVVDNADPEKLGRLKVQVPSVLGSDVVTGWAMPCVPYGGDVDTGFLFIPEIGAGVWVEFEEGDLEFPIWVGTFWSKPGGDSELPKPNDADGMEQGEVQDPPTRKIIKTKKGHTIQLEDADGEEMVLLVEAVNGQVVTMNQDGIKVTDGKNGNTVTLDNNGIVLEDKNGNVIVMDSMSGFPAGAGIKLNAGTGRVCMEDLITWLLSHQHVGNMGAPTPLFPANITDLTLAMSGATNILSKKLKVE